jgi:hypothetical protein
MYSFVVYFNPIIRPCKSVASSLPTRPPAGLRAVGGCPSGMPDALDAEPLSPVFSRAWDQ